MLNIIAFSFVRDVLDLWYSGYFLFIAVERLWKCQEDEEAQLRGNKETSNSFSCEQLNEEADKVKKPEDAAELIKRYEEILRKKKKGIISSISSGKTV